MRWLHVKIRGGLFALRCTANLYKQNGIAAVLRFHQCCLCTRLCPAKAPKTLLQKHRRAVAAMEGKGVVCVCRMWDFMEGDRFASSPAKLLSWAREIPGSSVWTHCFYTLEALCCCVNHPDTVGARAAGLTMRGVIGCHMLGGLWEKEGLQSFSNRV